jgi:serine/threonine protein kinase
MSDQIKIGHYILGKTIGTGGFAKVKSTIWIDIAARHDLTNIEVAVKIINKKKMKNTSMISKVNIIQ